MIGSELHRRAARVRLRIASGRITDHPEYPTWIAAISLLANQYNTDPPMSGVSFPCCQRLHERGVEERVIFTLFDEIFGPKIPS